MSLSSSYKPSPLSFGSPRTSPFRRPESPASPFRRPESPSSPSTTNRPTTPTPSISPTKPQIASPFTSPTKLQNTTTTTPTSETNNLTPRGLTPSFVPRSRSPPTSPSRTSSIATAINLNQPTTSRPHTNDAISRLPPAQVREMREAYAILDRSNSGHVNRDDVVDILTNLGQPSSASDVTPFFPPGAPQTLALPTFLSSLSSLLAPLSSQTELLNAFAAFDDHDGGEVDVAELKDALLHTAPERGERNLSQREIDEALGGFVGRKAFGRENMSAKGGAGQPRGESFRYREWVGNVMGAGEEKNENEK